MSLVVGVTGHRDVAIDDEKHLRAAFGRTLQRLSQSCPNTPLLVLSGLAAGTDSLAAEEAFARNIPVMACLPMPISEYEKDFLPAELARFRVLLSQCSRVAVTSPTREKGYVALGHFIAQYSHVLVAFWDEETSRGAGGTSEVVDMRMTSRPQPVGLEDIPYLPDVGPVDVIVTPRIRARRPAESYSVKRLYPEHAARDRTAAANFKSILSHVDTYNVDLSRTFASNEESPLQSLMQRTDDIANRLRKRTNYFQLFLFLSAFVAAAVQIVGVIPTFAKVSGLLVAGLAYIIARRNDYENRYQDYRAITEGLRVQSAWHFAGLHHRLADNEYLRTQEGEVQWIRMALRFFFLLCCEGRKSPDPEHQLAVSQNWVRSQWRYYYRVSRRQKRLKKMLDGVAVAALAIGAAFFVVAAVELGRWLPCALDRRFCAGPSRPEHFYLLQSLLTVPFVIGAMLGAILAAYSEKHSVAVNARRYERMFFIFDRARRELAGIAKGRAGDYKDLIYKLGRTALIEHADWLIIRRDRPMKVVIG